MSPFTIIDAARASSANHSNIQEARLAFHVGYLESSIFELCDLLAHAEKVMKAQKDLIEKMEKGVSASLQLRYHKGNQNGFSSERQRK